MQWRSKCDKIIWFLLCVINIFSKYAWVVSLKTKKGVNIVNAFHRILGNSKRKPKKVWVHEGYEFYNRSMRSWLEKSDIEIYLAHNEVKSVVAKIFIRTFEIITTHMTSI